MAVRAGKTPPDEATAVLNALRRIVRFLRLADREVEAACDVSAAQLFVLHTLVDQPAASISELAQRTLTDQSSVSTVVTRLVERGLVSRTPSRTDRRRSQLRITAAGLRMVQRAPRVPQALMITAIRDMPAARRAELTRALEGLAAIIGANEVAPRMLFEDEPPRPRPRRRTRA
jgi:MarR family transcriptional regulator, lower aerobic nicotinate degradation pathway regulator